MSYQIGDIVCDYRVFNDKTDEYVILNSRKNAETVKRILEVDSSVPNQATVCDMVEVVRCKDCKRYSCNRFCDYYKRFKNKTEFCSAGKRKTDNEKQST